MAFIPAILTSIGSLSAGSLISAGGAIIGGISALAAGNYQKQVADMNAKIAKDNAARAEQRGQVEQQMSDQRAAGAFGEQVAAQSATGISLTSRSAIASRKSSRELGRLDALNIRQGADVEAYNYQVDAVNQKAQGTLAQASGINGFLGSFFKAGGSLIGDSSSLSDPGKYTAGSTSATYDPWAGMRRKTVGV